MRSLAVCLLALALGGRAGATAPLGGDDSGFVPPTAAAARCQTKATRNVAKLGTCLARCHVVAVSAAFAGAPADDELCEAACVVRYQTKAVGILEHNECPFCLDQTGFGSALGAFMDAALDVFYCAGTTPLPSPDDAGFVPPDQGTLQCESKLLVKGANVARCVLRCHAKQAERALGGSPFDEEACEDHCQLTMVVGSYPGTCPPCLAFLPGVAGTVRDFLDAANHYLYCTSPSGAFLDG